MTIDGSAYAICQELEELRIKAESHTAHLLEKDDLAYLTQHFGILRDHCREIKAALNLVQAHVENLSREVLPTLFLNKGMKTARFSGIGRATIVEDWSAKMIDPPAAMQWLTDQGNGGVIKQSVHHETLAAMAKEAAQAGKPFPDTLFKVGTSNHVSFSRA